MGIGDRIRQGVADRTEKVAVGMDPDVCIGCPERGGPPLNQCGLCGCPTLPGWPLHKFGMVPEDCRRIDEHARRG